MLRKLAVKFDVVARRVKFGKAAVICGSVKFKFDSASLGSNLTESDKPFGG